MMEAFIWNQYFTTGLEKVDQQHHHLVDLINKLGEALIAGEVENPESLQATFGELAEYAIYHFSEEERLMADASVSAFHREPHCHNHAEFIKQVSSMWSSRNSMTSAADTLHDYLRSWLGFHILGEDQAMARQIALIHAGHSPEQAFDMDQARRDNATSALLMALHNLYHVLTGQNRDLAAINAHLEEKVAARTDELAKANLTLSDLNRQLEALSNSDGLLGIANRRYFDIRLDLEWSRAAREQQPVSLLMLDVDFFKRYNDTYGHQAGDACLQSVAKAARAGLKRATDLLARYGGEEMVVILPNTELNGAILVAQAIQQELAGLHIPHGDSAVADVVTVSIGAATMKPDRQNTAAMLIAAADRGLYAAKEGGRNTVCPGS